VHVTRATVSAGSGATLRKATLAAAARAAAIPSHNGACTGRYGSGVIAEWINSVPRTTPVKTSRTTYVGWTVRLTSPSFAGVSFTFTTP
jgi:hypothetical protein